MIALFPLLALFGCAGAEIVLSEGARQALVANFEASVDAQQRIAEFAFAAAPGEVDISSYTYTPPAGSARARSRSKTASSLPGRAI